MKGSFSNSSSLTGIAKRSRNWQRVEAHLLLLVRDHLAFAGLAHAVALTVLARMTVGRPRRSTAAL